MLLFCTGTWLVPSHKSVFKMTCLHLYKKKNITAKEINNTMKLTVWTESNLTVYDSAFFLSCLTPKLF